MVKIAFDARVRDEILQWLHNNVDCSSKPNFEPNHGSWINKTVTWRSMRSLWAITQDDIKHTLIINCFDPVHETYISSIWL